MSDFLDDILAPADEAEDGKRPRACLVVGEACKTSEELTRLARYIEAHRTIVTFVEEDGPAQTVR
jgi:hypothetical protein